MDSKEYKSYHEKYMSHNSGTSTEECIVLLSTIPVNIFISSWLSSQYNKVPPVLLEFSLIIVLTIFNCTIFSEVNHLVLLNLILIAATIFLSKLDVSKIKLFLDSELPNKKTYITNYRAGTNFYSTLCILAVDFTVFPKRFAKTETFGFGFMDLGVGFFVCSNGLVEKHSKTTDQFTNVLKSVFVLCFLGTIRLISIKSIDYPEHISEYGVHWNFFFTLAGCRLISYVIMLTTNYANPLWLAIATGVTHQIFLNLGLQDWVLSNTQRNSFLTANKEGLTSCLGYVCLYFSASCVGKYLAFPKTTYKNILIKLFLISLIIWTGYFIFINTTGCSRRLVNLGYIFWVLALSMTEITSSIWIEFSLFCLRKKKGEKPASVICIPVIFDGINANGLFFFLFGNLLTGLVNNIFQTLLLGKVAGVVIIVSYMAVLCSLTCYLNAKKIYLKL